MFKHLDTLSELLDDGHEAVTAVFDQLDEAHEASGVSPSELAIVAGLLDDHAHGAALAVGEEAFHAAWPDQSSPPRSLWRTLDYAGECWDNVKADVAKAAPPDLRRLMELVTEEAHAANSLPERSPSDGGTIPIPYSAESRTGAGA